MVTRILWGQALITLLLALVALVVSGVQAAGSAVLGGAIGTGATFYMASRALTGSADDDGQAMLRRFYRAEVLKIGLTVFMFVVAFRFLPIAPLWMLGAYAATYAAYWLVMIGEDTGTSR
jgi:ATP synthase protein I